MWCAELFRSTSIGSLRSIRGGGQGGPTRPSWGDCGASQKLFAGCGKRQVILTDGGTKPDSATVDGRARMLREGQITRRGFLARAVGFVDGWVAAENLLARVVGAQTTSKTDLVIAQGSDISKLDRIVWSPEIPRLDALLESAA